jgi:hypothetical protein
MLGYESVCYDYILFVQLINPSTTVLFCSFLLEELTALWLVGAKPREDLGADLICNVM